MYPALISGIYSNNFNFKSIKVLKVICENLYNKVINGINDMIFVNYKLERKSII